MRQQLRCGALALGLFIGSFAAAFGQTNPGTSPLSILKGGTGAISAAAARINLGFGSTANRLYGTDGSGVSTQVSLPAAGLSLSGSALSLANDLAALEGLSSTGICRRTGTDAWSVGTAVANSELATMAAYTLKGNNSGSTAAPGDIDIAALTTKASPAAGDYVMISDQAASGAFKKATVSSVGSAGSVASIAGNTGAFTLGFGLANSGNDIRLGSGTVIGSAAATPYTANTILTANIPVDDSIPQSGEGTQILSQSYTPKISTSTLRVRFAGQGACAGADNFVAAMFNGGSNAFAAQMVTSGTSRFPLAFEGSYAPGATSAQTITVRVGCGSTNSALNGTPGARSLGGASGATLVIEEIAP